MYRNKMRFSDIEIRDLVNLVHAVATGDAVSTAGALRSPLLGLSDQDLQDLADRRMAERLERIRGQAFDRLRSGRPLADSALVRNRSPPQWPRAPVPRQTVPVMPSCTVCISKTFAPRRISSMSSLPLI